MPVGRPLKYQTVEELQALIDTYFNRCKATGEPLLITALGLAVGLSRQQLIEYRNRDEFHDALKEARQKIEMDYELSLRRNGRAGDIFGLKNFGWSDKKELTHTGADGKDLNWNITVVSPKGNDK